MATPNLTVQRWRRRKSECFFQHTCFERFTANKVAAFLRAGQKDGNYFVRISERRKTASFQTPPWKREYWYAVRVYRRVVPLLLLGWYLLMPPWIGPMRFDPQAPFSRWEVTAAYDTADDCQSNLVWLALQYKAHPSTYQFEHPDAGYLRCIASDDPRLAY